VNASASASPREEIGIEGEPELRFYPVTLIFNPRVPASV
jgi:hypothetical protein